MCLIIASREGKIPTCGVIEQGWKDNSDGWGLMQSDGSNIIVNKGMRFDDLKPLLEQVNGNPYVLHYRWATHGNKNIDNCHPFRVTKNLYMAHNGVIGIECSNKLMSDTWHFAKKLREIGVDHDDIKDEGVIAMIEDHIGKSNKLAFLDHKGAITFANENSGTWQDGVWFSNANSFYSNSDWGWEAYYSRRYSNRYAHSSRFNNIGEAAAKVDQSISTGYIHNDERFYEDGSDLWDNCEYCNTLDWLEEVHECDSMHLCMPCKKVLVPLYADIETTDTANSKNLEGINAGIFYDSNRVPYSWDDVDDTIAQVRHAYERGRAGE